MIPAKYRKSLIGFIGVVLFLWLVVIAVSLWVFMCGSAERAAKWGQFGDAFGIINSLFSGLALIGVVAALVLQREDIDASIRAQEDAAKAQASQARIAAMAAALTAMERRAESLTIAAKSEPTSVKIKDRPVQLLDIVESLKKDMLEIDYLLDKELRVLVPDYKSETPK